MSNNIHNSKTKSLVNANNLVDVETTHSLQKVSNEIQQVVDVVDYYKRKIETLQPPVVNGEPWYKFSFGKASVKEVNKAMESFSSFVLETFGLVAKCQNLQNENDMNMCRLIGLLAMAEANSYTKILDLSSEVKDLSTEDEESARQLRELEQSFLQSIEDSETDNAIKEQQMSRLIDYVTLFAESKTKKIRNISLSISKLENQFSLLESNQSTWQNNSKKEFENLKTDIQNKIIRTKKDYESLLQDFSTQEKQRINTEFNQLRLNIQTNLEKQKNIISEAIEAQNNAVRLLQSALEEENEKTKAALSNISIQLSKIEESVNVFESRLKLLEQFKTDVEEKRTFLDSYTYKVMVGVCSLSALVAAILSYL